MKTFRVVFLYLPALFLLAAAIFVYFALEDRPVVSDGATATTADATRARGLARTLVDQMLNARSATTVPVRERDIDGVFALMNRALPRATGDARLSSRGMALAVTLRLPKNPLGGYVNLRFGVRPSGTGLSFSDLSLGRMRVAGDTVARLLRYGLNMALGDDAGDQIFASIRSVRFTKTAALFNARPVPDMRARLKSLAQKLGDARDKAALLGDPQRIQAYYTRLVELEDIGRGPRTVSLAAITGPLFRYVKDRSGFNDPVVENRAALLAMVIFFGDARFERLTGAVRTGALKGHRPRTTGVRLGGRGDLLLHFVISTGLKLVADFGVAMTIGEFKELLDSAGGGSGFSFVDLAADRTGLRFAEVATADAESARRVQNILAGKTDEKLFFPSVTDLPEGMPEAVFTRRYGGIDDPRYKAMVKRIEDRIAMATLYRKR